LEDIYPDLTAAGSSGTQVSTVGPQSRKRKLQQPPLDFTGFAAKFVNLSPDPVLLHWDGKGGNTDDKRLVGEIPPFESLGTATNPGHSFHVTPIYDSTTALERWVLTADSALVYYEPKSHDELKQSLNANDYTRYQRQLVNQAYARDYLISSQRTWLGHFPPRAPVHYMHPADYIGQEHKVGDFSLEVISVAPRAFLIDNFLSPEDCQAIVDLSQQQGLELSTLHTGATAKQTRDLSTRSSSNTWLARDSNSLTEEIYKRAAQVMQLDPELFQKYHDSSAHHHSIAESLQVVKYKKDGEQYQSHHDFVYPSINNRYQPSRFATLLIYLNDVPQGGETRFPRALNNHNSRGLEIQPKIGQAVLFYNMLEDGNLDDLSQHGGNPTDGHEKWLANLWIWNPIIG
jgi:prolyl 4-hydroxylase